MFRFCRSMPFFVCRGVGRRHDMARALLHTCRPVRRTDNARYAAVWQSCTHECVCINIHYPCRVFINMQRYACNTAVCARERRSGCKYAAFEALAQCSDAQPVGFSGAADKPFWRCGRASSMLPNGLSCVVEESFLSGGTCFPISRKCAFCR